MSLELWIAFVAASAALLALPGPTVILITSYAMNQGRRTGLATIPGVALGDFVAMTTSLLGAGAVLAASATLFTALKLVGAAYLVWLGFKLWKSRPELGEITSTGSSQSLGKMFWNAFIVTALNPKGIVFFVAFIPQFIDPAEPAFIQFVILEATFVTMAAINIALWVFLTDRFRAKFQNPRLLNSLNKTGASFLMGAGVFTALVGRNS
ncbi:LysE family translocator [Sneathiella limimaris]|uniref:LysE family translocator n=1 Tax=Sneathiella limimaris TaxID=1964213 RepID=UPI00146C3BD8|nr:LysE family translocator [Sneathiella limimaris]